MAAGEQRDIDREEGRTRSPLLLPRLEPGWPAPEGRQEEGDDREDKAARVVTAETEEDEQEGVGEGFRIPRCDGRGDFVFASFDPALLALVPLDVSSTGGSFEQIGGR